MSVQTTTVEKIDKDAVPDRLNDLTPSGTVDYRIDVVEKQSRFRGNRETVRIEIDWKLQ